MEEAANSVWDVLAAAIETYKDPGKPFPANLRRNPRILP